MALSFILVTFLSAFSNIGDLSLIIFFTLFFISLNNLYLLGNLLQMRLPLMTYFLHFKVFMTFELVSKE